MKCSRFAMAGALLAVLLTLPLAAQTPSPGDDKDISGTYTFVRDGETVQINVEADGVHGWITRFGESDSDKGQRIDQFFDKAALAGDQLSFTTKVIHGVWFEFQGKVARGPAKSRAEEGYFVIHGTLKEYTSDANQHVSAREREVDFKLFPEDVDRKAG
ncbi:MAG TPA: hypothetical protein VE825_01970 [Terriglobales bacterium]|nr:hypothetical protein [Terriglobales bacterium]